MPFLIGQARPPHPRFLITIGPVWRRYGGGACIWYCHLPQCDRLPVGSEVGEHQSSHGTVPVL